MISEEQQELAALYALGLLSADEAAEFERLIETYPEVADLTRELRDAAASVAADLAPAPPPALLRAQVLNRVAAERKVALPAKAAAMSWVPWAAAAALALCCGLLAVREGRLRREVAALRDIADVTASAASLERITFCSLQPTPEARPQPRAAVAWDASRNEGIVELSHLDPPERGKDYQLWVVEQGVEKPVSAGIVHVDPEGGGRSMFKPDPAKKGVAQAFALSIEQAGGVPEGKGPIVLLGKL